MFSRYPGGHGPFDEPAPARNPEPSRDARQTLEKASPESAAARRPMLGKNFNISGFLQNFKIDWDAGDILLILIMLFLFLESDDEEILIMLALILFMGF